MDRGNIFRHIPDTLPAERFDTLLRGPHVQIERIVSQGHTAPASGWFEQPRNEWVIILQGTATILFDDGERVEMSAGDYLAIPAMRRHRVCRTDPEQHTIWLAVHHD